MDIELSFFLGIGSSDFAVVGDKSEIGRAGWRPRKELVLQLFGGRIPSCGDLGLFLSRPSTHWARPTHIVEGDLLYSKSTYLF